MNFHSNICYHHQLHDYTHECICWKEIQSGDYVRFYPDLSDDNTWIDGTVIETFINGQDKEVKLDCITNAVKAVQCILITFKNAA